MGKKFKPKAIQKQEQQSNDPSHSMMTEQEEKMFYANKKMTLQNGHLSHIKKKNTTVNTATNYQNDEEQNLQHFQLSNLNQTSAQEITEFINKLIAKNKVTSKNAFDIPLIHLEQMEDFRSSLNENTWKRLSSTLQNDYKIYGYRVDAAHTITYKMVESIARHQAAGEEIKSGGISGLNKSMQVGKSKTGSTNNELLNSFIQTSFNNENISRNKMNVDYTKFIQKNQKLINVTHIEAFFGCNPGLEKTKRKFDQQGLKALLLNNIALRNGCELKLDQHRRYNLQLQNDKIKKENVDNSSQLQTQQNDDLIQFQTMYERIFNPAIPQNKIQLENQPPQQSVFDLIYQLNINECKSNQDEYKKFEKLYKIISGQDRQEKRLLGRKKQIDGNVMIDEEKFEMGCVQENGLINDEPKADQEGQIVKNNQDIESKLIETNDKKQQQNEKADPQVMNLRLNQNAQHFVTENSQQPQNQLSQLSPRLDIIPQTISLQNYLNEQKKQKQPIHNQPQLQSHPLINKNFQMHELNLERMEQSQSSKQQSSNKQLSSVYTGKFKNIQEYIKIKQQKVKHQKKAKILIGDMTSQEIGWKLFNRKYKKKKNQSIKSQHILKQESGSQLLKKKVDFNKIAKPSNDLKRSIIFKKSQTQQRTFTQIKDKIKKKLQERQKNKQKDQAQNVQKKRKGKKTTKLFDLSVYQFQQGDTNFIQPYEQIDPLTNQLEFSQIYRNHFPSFVQSSSKIIDEIKKKKQQKERQAQQLAKMKQNERKEFQNQIIEQDQNANELNCSNQNNDNQNNLQNPERPENQQNQDQQLDISFIGDEMGQYRGKNQIAIRDAKQKVRKIILQMFYNLKSRKNKSKKQKKVSFKEIYEAYYRRQGFISPALCFLTILHLANEHNLVLEGKQDGTDFKIFVEEQNEISQKMKENDMGMQIEPMLEEYNVINKSVSQSIMSSTKQEEKAQQEVIQVE